MKKAKVKMEHGFGVKLEMGRQPRTRTVSTSNQSNGPNEYLEKRRESYMKNKAARENKGLIDMNSLLKN